MAFQFKTNRTSITLPTWEVLSAKIISFYKIKSKQICISYISHNDLVAIDSDEELQWYYKKHPSPPLGFFKISVQDLSSPDSECGVPSAPILTRLQPQLDQRGLNIPTVLRVRLQGG